MDCTDDLSSKGVLLENLVRGRSMGGRSTCRNPWGGVKESEEAARLSKVHSAIQQRCENPENRAYHLYGGKGIRIASTLREFWDFFHYVTGLPGYEEGKDLDRIDATRGYEEGNLQWLDKFEHMAKDGVWEQVTYAGTIYASFKDFWRDNVKGLGYSHARRLYRRGVALEELVRATKQRTWTQTRTKQADRVGLVKCVEQPSICGERGDDWQGLDW